MDYLLVRVVRILRNRLSQKIVKWKYIEGRRMNIDIRNNEKGSMTIESAIVLPLLIFVLLSIISAALYLHDTYVGDIRGMMGMATSGDELLRNKGDYPIFIPGMKDLSYHSVEVEPVSYIEKEGMKQWQIFYMFDAVSYYVERLKIVQDLFEKKDDLIESIKDIMT